VRIAAWAFVLCTVLGLLGVFVPCVGAEGAGRLLGRRATLSLYQVEHDRAIVRRFFAAYAASSSRKLGEAITAALVPKLGAHAMHLDDAQSAMESLDQVQAGDVDTGIHVFIAVFWGLLALQVIAIAIVFAGLMRESFGKGRLAAALVVAVVIAAIAIALHVGLRQAVWEANDEVDVTAFGLSGGAYLLPAGAIGAVIAAVALLAVRARSTRPSA